MLIAVTNLRINNNATSERVKITDPFPIFNWDFTIVPRATIIDGVATTTTDINVLGFEIRLGTNSTNLGSDSFNGNIFNTSFIQTDSQTWRYKDTKLTRGNTYYGQIKLTDETLNISDWYTFSFQYNSLSSVISSSILPSNPTVNDSLRLTYTFADNDGDTENGTKIWWYKNGIHERQFDGLVEIAKENMIYGDQWVAHIFPKDGYEFGKSHITSTVTISKEIPVVSNLTIEPENPTTVDPLYAIYNYTSAYQTKDQSNIRWFINNELVSGVNTAFARLDLAVGDVVRFEIQPSDGEITGVYQASADVTIGKAPLQIVEIVIDGEPEPLSLANTEPSISWRVFSPDRQFNKVSIKIGTAPGGNNIFETTVNDAVTVFTVPKGTLVSGIDYYVSVAVGDDEGFGDYSTAHFRTSGSRWDNVSNATGWTFETTMRIAAVSPPSSSSSSSITSSSSSSASNIDSSYYHGIRLYDGTKYCELRIFQNSIVFISNTIVEVLFDFTKFTVITVTGHGSDVNIYANYELLYDGTGELLKTTTEKLIEIGSIGESSYVTAEYLNFFYTTEGAFEPASSPKYYDLQYSPFYETAGSIDFISGSPGGNIYYSVSSDQNDLSSTIYQLSDYKKPIKAIPVANNIVKTNRIALDPDNKWAYFAHDLGVTSMHSYLIPSYDNYMNFINYNNSTTMQSILMNYGTTGIGGIKISDVNEDNTINSSDILEIANKYGTASAANPEDYNWKLISGTAQPLFNSSGLVLDTRTAAGKLYYSQGLPGTKWFDNVNNKNGWTVGFSLSTTPYVHDDKFVSNTDDPDGAGVYINDGYGWENIIFYPQEIYLKNRDLRLSLDTTVDRNYVIVGKNDNLKIYSKLPSEVKYELLTDTKLLNTASKEANGNRPDIVEFDDILYSVWHDDGAGYQRIFISSFDKNASNKQWTNPKLIVDEKYGASNPSITVDDTGTIYVAYESHRSDGSDIGMVVKNRYGWSKPFVISADTQNSLSPQIISDANNNIHAVWEDYRNNVAQIFYSKRNYQDGKWSQPIVLSDSTLNCTRPAIDIDNTDVYVCWTEQNSGNQNIRLRKYIYGFNAWTVTLNVSSNNRADCSDIAVRNNVIYIVWHENNNDSFEIYGRRIKASDLTFLSTETRLTKDNEVCRFPRIGINLANDVSLGNAYVTFEIGGDLGPYEYAVNSASDTFIGVLRFSLSDNKWHSSNQSDGHNVEFLSANQRYSRRPNIPKKFNTNAHIVYEAEETTPDEFLTTANRFTNIYDAIYDLSADAVYYIIESDVDKRVSARLPRRELRFGDFSDSRNHCLTFGYFNFYTKDAVEPFSITYLPFEAPANDVSPNQSGDAWLATSDRLLFYLNNKEQLANTKVEINQPLRIRFDSENRIFVLNNPIDSEIFKSDDYVTFETWSNEGSILDFDFAPDNSLWMITSTHTIQYNSETKEVLAQYPLKDLVDLTSYPSAQLKRIIIDGQGIVWLATSGGLTSINRGKISNWNPKNSALSVPNVSDISIKNTGTRFVATSGGLYKMVGGSFQKIIISEAEWSENLTAVAWSRPNIVWTAGYSKIFQIVLDDDKDTYELVTFNSKDFANYDDENECQDFTDYTFDTPDGIDENTVMELYINGRIVKHGYQIGTGRLRLESPLNSNDRVEILIRKDVSKYVSLEQNVAEKLAYGTVERRFSKFIVDNNESIYGLTEGDRNQMVFFNNLKNLSLPYDSIVFDNVPPTGYLVFEKQVNPRTVQLFFDEVQDNISGVIEMKVSNYANLTSDGTTELSWQPFKEKFLFDIGTDLGNIFTTLSFSGEKGTRLHNYLNYVLAGTASPASIYLLNATLPEDANVTSATFIKVFDFPDEPADTSVEFFVNYLGSVIVGTGSPTGQGKLWISSDGINYRLLQVLSGTHALCGTVLNGVVYIGTKGGPIYKYNNQRVDSIGVTLGSGVYSIYGANNFLWCGTGLNGKIYKVNTDINSANSQNLFTPTFIHSENDTIISAILATNLPAVTASTTQPPDDFIVFAAGSSNGRLIKSINKNPFGPSLVTVPVPISMLKLNDDGLVHACVGKNLYRYTSSRSWKPLFTNNSNIHDVAFDQKGVWVISDSTVKRVLFENAKKRIFFALRDAAGNSSRDPEDTTAIADFEEINIDDLRQFVNENRILELDEYGSEVFRYTGTGDTSFYSANKVEVERAEYYSEIFNGTSDHVSWDLIYWDAYVPEGTDLKIDVRAAATRDEVLSSQFVKNFNKEDFEGGDISSLSGQYLQFRVTMTTEIRGKTPKLYRVNVKSRTRSSVHFFTTNFILPSKMNKGILTATTMVPVSADIIFGIDTNDSTDFSTYQIIEPDRIFTLDSNQVGTNIRIGIKLISPLKVIGAIDDISEYNEYSEGVYNNIIEFNYTPSATGTYNFAAQFYTDPELSDLATSLYSSNAPEAWSIDGQSWDSSGVALTAGTTYKIICGVRGNAAIRCNQFYYIRLYESKNSESFNVFQSDFSFIASCNPNFTDSIDFVHVNDGATATFSFRVKFYSDPTRTQLVKTFYSGLDDTGWIANGLLLPTSGISVASGQPVIVTFIPPNDELENGTYYLTIDAYNGNEFIPISNSYFIKIMNDSSYSCGEYTNVPVVKDIAVMFELDDFLEKFGSKEKTKRTIMLNLNA